MLTFFCKIKDITEKIYQKDFTKKYVLNHICLNRLKSSIAKVCRSTFKDFFI